MSYSSGVALQAARYFYLRRYLTKFGMLQIASTVVLIAFALVIHHYLGATWIFGFFLAILVLNAAMQIAMITGAPSGHAKAIASYTSKIGRVSTDEEGFTITISGNVVSIPWTKIRYLWPQRDFIVLGISYFTMLHLPTEGMSSDVRADFEKRASRQVGA